MDKKTVFVKTNTGESEVSGQSDALYGDAKRILHLVDDESTVGEISKRAPPSLRDSLNEVLQELVDGGFIRDMRAPVNVPQKPALKMATPGFKMATPRAAPPSMPTPSSAMPSRAAPAAVTPTRPAETPSRAAPASSMPSMSMPDMTMPAMSTPEIKKEEPASTNNKADLDFSFITSGSSPGTGTAKAAPDRAQAEASARAAQESERLKAAQAAQIEASAQAAKLRAYEEAKEKAKIEVAMRAKIETEARAKNEAEAARQRAEQEVLKARSELEATKARVEAEVRARIEAEARVKQEMEAAKVKVEMEMQNRLEAEARAKAEVEARVKREAEIERLRIEKERAELEAARIKAEAEIRMRAEAEMRVRAEVEARLKREADAEHLRLQNERAELEAARAKAEAEIRMRTDAEMRVRAEVEARLKAEALAKQQDQAAAQQAALRSAGFSQTPAKEEQIDQAEKLRQSFVESFAQQKNKQGSNTGSFKLEQFSFVNTGKMPAATTQSLKAEVPPGGGSKVKAALEQRAQKEAEAKRLQAEQEAARLKVEQDAAARIKAEQDSIRLKAEQEAYRLKVAQDEERAKVEAERAKAEAEAQKLTHQQSRQWEDAQQRAANQAQAEKERLAQQAAAAKVSAQQKSARGPRKSLPIGKMASSLLVLALIAVAGLPYIWPLEEYIAPLEQEISAQFNQPVHISKIHLAVLPTPKLELHNLTVGSGQELKVADAVLHFDFSALFAHTKSINNLELNNVTIAGATLDKALVWLQAAGGIEKYPVARIELLGVRVNSDEIKLPPLSGRANFDAQGKFLSADLKDESEKLRLELQTVQNYLKLELNVHESNLPILTNIKFNDLSASGLVENGEFIFSDFFAHIHNGTLTGKGKLNWSNGWKIQGQINAKNMDLKRMFPDYVVTGELNGDASISMTGSALSQLDKDPRMEGTFSVKNGVINKVDIDSVARFGARQGVAGHTDFNELLGTIKADSRGQRIYLSKISSVVVNGTGLVEVDDKQQLSGKLQVDIKGPANGNVSLQLSGTPKEPILQSGR